MPEGSGASISRWRRIGALLPAEVRERIYEPALTEAWYRWHTAPQHRRRVPFALHALGTVLGCLPQAATRLFVRQGDLTWLGRLSLILAISLLTLLVIAQFVAMRTPGY